MFVAFKPCVKAAVSDRHKRILPENSPGLYSEGGRFCVRVETFRHFGMGRIMLVRIA
ncbi:protein of unknown function (plasmid) [Shinella sp. WSC3-e]|nr:protein of unknown function [Shinella sp. WSC3-e]